MPSDGGPSSEPPAASPSREPATSAAPTSRAATIDGQIAYVAGADPQIHLLDLATGESRQLTNLGPEDAELSEAGLRPVVSCFFGPSGLSWAPDGSRLAFTYGGCDGVVHVVDLAGNTQRIADGRGPAWSPDGRLLVFAPNVPYAPCGMSCLVPPYPGAFDLHVVDVGGAAVPRPLTVDGASFAAGQAVFSPDGRWIAHTGPIPDDVADPEVFAATYLTAVDDGASRLLRVGAWPIGWLDDGRLAVMDERSSEALIVDPTTMTSVPVLPGRTVQSISRDGRLAVEWASDPVTGENLLRLRGSTGNLLTEMAGTFGAWSPDGRLVALLGSELDELVVIDGSGAVAAALPIVGSAAPMLAWRPAS